MEARDFASGPQSAHFSNGHYSGVECNALFGLVSTCLSLREPMDFDTPTFFLTMGPRVFTSGRGGGSIEPPKTGGGGVFGERAQLAGPLISCYELGRRRSEKKN